MFKLKQKHNYFAHNIRLYSTKKSTFYKDTNKSCVILTFHFRMH